MEPKYLKLTPEELEKVARRKSIDESKKIDPEWQLLGEFGVYYGYAAIQAVRNNEIETDEFNSLLLAGRKNWYGKVVDMAFATRTAVVAANSKKPKDVMRKGLKEFMKELQ